MDYCNGTSHYWSNDSYSSGHYPCPGPGKCPYATKEVPEPMKPDNPSVALTVSIPVKRGGYTGQRDQWEEFERQHAVSYDADADQITLTSSDTTQSNLSFSKAGLLAALSVLARYDSDAQTKPVYREPGA